MRRIIFLFIFTFIIAWPITLLAEKTEKQILVKTVDNTEAIEYFKKKLLGDYGMLSRNGFGYGSKIGTPFSVEYQELLQMCKEYPELCSDKEDGYGYLFFFPIINSDGEIITYVQQNIKDDDKIIDADDKVSWAVAKFFDGESDLTQLSDGNAYYIVRDKERNRIAFSDKKTVILSGDNLDYYPPYEGKETKIVNIMEPLDIDTSFIIPQVKDERDIFEHARERGKGIVLRNADGIGAVNKNNRILLPLREAAEIMNCTIDWNSQEKAAYVKKDENIIKFVVGKNQYTINDKTYNFDVPSEIINDKVYIPIRAASEALGADIAYNPLSRDLVLSY